MLKRLLESVSDLPEAIQALYTEGADGKFTLEVEAEDVSALKNAKDHEKQARIAAQDELREHRASEQAKIDKAAADARTAALEEARSGSDIAALDASWKAKFDAAEAEHKAAQDTLNAAVHDERISGTAKSIAESISTTPVLLQSVIEKRLTTEMVDGKFNTRVLDSSGKPSAMTVDELKTEISGNADYKHIIKAGKAGGGGASNPKGGSATKDFSEMNAAERVALKRKNPENFRTLAAQDAANVAQTRV